MLICFIMSYPFPIFSQAPKCVSAGARSLDTLWPSSPRSSYCAGSQVSSEATEDRRLEDSKTQLIRTVSHEDHEDHEVWVTLSCSV